MTGAGLLDRRIELQSATVSNDPDYNEQTETWATYATVWAQVRYLAEAERHSAEKWFSEQILVFRIRWRSGVEANHRVVYDGNTYEVRGPPREINRREYLDVPARLVE